MHRLFSQSKAFLRAWHPFLILYSGSRSQPQTGRLLRLTLQT